MSTPAEDGELSVEAAAKRIAQSIADAFSGLFDYEGHSTRDRNYWQKGPGQGKSAAEVTRERDKFRNKVLELEHERDEAIALLADDEVGAPGASLSARVRELLVQLGDAERYAREGAAYLEKIRKPITETLEQKAAQEILEKFVRRDVIPFDQQSPMNKAIITVLDDLKMWKDAYVEALSQSEQTQGFLNQKAQRVDQLSRDLEAMTAERDKAVDAKHVAEACQLSAEHSQERAEQDYRELSATIDEAMAVVADYPGSFGERVRQLAAERDRYKAEHANAVKLLKEQTELDPLAGVIQRMNDVITDQIEAVGSGSTLSRAANIRRLQARDHDLAHDRAHGWSVLAQAATAVQMRRPEDWPWDDGWVKLCNLPLSERLAHAAALLCAAGDVAKAEGL